MVDRFGAGGRAALVVTSVNGPTRAMRMLAEGASEREIDFLVIGDRKGPSSFDLPGVLYRSYESQLASDFAYAAVSPPGHYARKNLGYLEAVSLGAEVIVETDDDNFPRPSFFGPRSATVSAEVVTDAGWVNIFALFSEAGAWPRGFPLQFVKSPVPASGAVRSAYCPIQNGLADDDPDVDAVYRLVGELPVTFAAREPVILERSWCPYNSQNTTHFPTVYPLAYLPRHCSFRMTDIWRGLIAERILWENEWGLLFHGPTVWQERNEHDLLVDLADEMPGYLHNEAIVQRLASLDIPSGADRLFDAMSACYEELVRMGLIHGDEIGLLEVFQSDLAAAGWQPFG